jgi:hypothetical protein
MMVTIDTTPRWFDENFQPFLAYAEVLRDLCFTAVAGFRRIIKYPDPSEEILAGFREHFNRDHTEIRQRYQEQYRFALEEERGRQYQLLYRTFTVSAWDSLDYFINDLLADWLINEPASETIPVVQEAAGRRMVQQAISQREQAYLTIQALAQVLSRGRPTALGVEKFERLLEPFGLSGAVDAETTGNLLALHVVRNVLVHRRGIVDERPARDLPSLGLVLHHTR